MTLNLKGGVVKDPATQQNLEAIRDLFAAWPVEVTGARNDPEAAVAALLVALQAAGIITDNTTAV